MPGFYSDLILKVAPNENPRFIEAWMRLEHPTLNGLGPAQCVKAATNADNEALAKSFGL